MSAANVKSLDRSLGLLHATASNMTTMVGIGPFITIPLIISAMGGPQAMLGWGIGAIIAICDGQVWAELSTALPGEGGTYVYLRDAYKKYVGKFVAFLFVWSFLLSGPFEIASGLIGMAHYLSFLWPGLTDIQIRMVALIAGIVTIVLQYNRVRFVGTVSVVLWIVMLVTIVITIVAAFSQFHAEYAFDFPKGWFSFSWGFMLGLGSATLIAMYDLLGYANICFMEEEVKDPGRVFPRAIFYSTIGVALIYAVMNFSILGVFPWREIQKSTHLVSDLLYLKYGRTPAVTVTILVACTAYGGIYALMMSYSRIPFAAARDGLFFSRFKDVHPTKHFPHVSLLLMGGLTCIASLFDLGFVIAATLSSRILVQFLGQIVGLTILRKSQPDLKRPYKMWLYPIPSIVAFCGFLFIFLSSGVPVIGLGMCWLFVGAIVFLWRAKTLKEWPFAPSESTIIPCESAL